MGIQPDRGNTSSFTVPVNTVLPVLCAVGGTLLTILGFYSPLPVLLALAVPLAYISLRLVFLLSSRSFSHSKIRMETRSNSSVQSLLTLIGCLIPISVCIYLANTQPLIAVGSVEFTLPDFVLVILVLLIGTHILLRGQPFLHWEFFLPLSFLLLSTTISAISADDRLRAAAAVVQLVGFGMLAWCFSLVTSSERFLRIIHALLALFIIQTLVATWQFIDGAPVAKGTFRVPQAYAIFMGFGSAVSFALFAGSAKIWRWLYLILSYVLLFGTLLGQRRAPWFAFAVAGLVVALYLPKRRKQVLTVLTATLLAGVLTIASIPKLREMTVARFAEVETQSEQENSLLARLALWDVAWRLFQQHPILGVGPKNFVSLVPQYLSSLEMMGEEALDPHNVWIGMLAEQGLIGLIAYIAFCIAVFRLGTSVLRRPSSEPIRALCLAYLAYHAFWFTMSYHYFTKGEGHIHFMLIGLMLGQKRHNSIEYPPSATLAPMRPIR